MQGNIFDPSYNIILYLSQKKRAANRPGGIALYVYSLYCMYFGRQTQQTVSDIHLTRIITSGICNHNRFCTPFSALWFPAPTYYYIILISNRLTFERIR